MTEKIIIENRLDDNMCIAMQYVYFVIANGKISKTGKGEQYCFVSVFANDVHVIAFKNDKSDRFVVHKPKVIKHD